MKYCYPKKTYFVQCTKLQVVAGGFRNFLRTGSLGKARYAASKIPVRHRQIDVYDRSKTYIISPKVIA